MSTLAATTEALPAATENVGKKHIRGSSLMLAGRVISLGLNFAVNVLLVRYLSVADFGAFSYALAVASLGAVVAACGLDKAIARFVPIYHEQADYPRMWGTMALALGAIVGVGLAFTAGTWAVYGFFANELGADPLASSLITILVLLAPLQALDHFLAKLVAVFSRPRAIFWRKHIVGPALKLCAAGSLVLMHSGVQFLAAVYLAASALGTLLYVFMLRAAFREQNLWGRMESRRIKLPARELFGYSVPLLSTDVVVVLRSSFAVFLLGYFYSNTSVAEFRAVLPVARLNHVVFESFILLFLPMASRMLARGDDASINDMYQRTATWIAVITFPVFAACFVLSEPLVVLLFGTPYAGAGPILAVLALGCYVNSAMGFNAVTLKVYGKVKWIVMIDAAAALLALVLGFLLIQRLGAIGAAWAVSLTHIVHNLLNQIALARLADIEALSSRCLRTYTVIIPVSAALLALQTTFDPPLVIGAMLVAAGSALVFLLTRDGLDIGDTFPELQRVPVVGRLCGLGAR